MNRCLRTLLAPAAIVLTLGQAQAQDIIRQTIPGNAQLGVMQVTVPPEVLIDGKVDRLSPGSRIRAENNMMVVSGALSGQKLLVAYVREPQGMLHDVWILNAAERAAVLQKQQAGPPATTSSGN
ncbi:hypothetical protein RQP54_02690 [Curvibacter sp. APW13]|uniref:hypothetical protein n=1 Tax=Curvibacter sp. APW13 TaxID=3077236 RepID=UPI0028DEEDDF|nr:hypothetical protein [Curvibacter sp. APW13]MDT8989761.1 hypothetical protein [Curvibacter sp. APW13]